MRAPRVGTPRGAALLPRPAARPTRARRPRRDTRGAARALRRRPRAPVNTPPMMAQSEVRKERKVSRLSWKCTCGAGGAGPVAHSLVGTAGSGLRSSSSRRPPRRRRCCTPAPPGFRAGQQAACCRHCSAAPTQPAHLDGGEVVEEEHAGQLAATQLRRRRFPKVLRHAAGGGRQAIACEWVGAWVSAVSGLEG